jgi:predicted acyl esterase
MMRAWVASLLVIPLLAGCLGDDGPEREFVPPDVGYDASEIAVSGFAREEFTIPGFDNVSLDAVVYEPLTTDTADGAKATFPVVIFVHPFGFPKETYEYLPIADEGDLPLPPTNLMQAWAEAGIITVSYDQRGWFRSDGQTTIAGPQEQKDVAGVMAYVKEHYPTNGRFGVTGMSSGGGMSYLAWQHIDDVVTAVPYNGWVDLYEAVLPGNVPKLEWGATLAAIAAAGTAVVKLGDTVPRWVTQAVTRTDLDGLHDEMGLRSIDPTTVRKPIFTCQGLQETLFHQSHLAWSAAPLSRGFYFTGGHNGLNKECWDLALDWFLFWLAGIDTAVDEWPVLKAVQVDGETVLEYDDAPALAWRALYLDSPALIGSPAPNSTFDVSQRLLANPVHEPSVIWDTLPLPFQDVPEQLRQDPTGVFFTSGGFDESHTILGAPILLLNATDDTRDGPWQVVATLYHKSEGNLRMLGRAAFAVIDDDDHDNGTVVLTFPWTHAPVLPGEQLVLKVASNDPSVFAPLLEPYDVTFSGVSRLLVPLLDPEDSPRGN